MIDEKVKELMLQLKAAGISVKYDDNDNNRPGWKFAEYEMIGIPVRLGLGQRDLAANQVEVARRDTKEKTSVPLDGITDYVSNLLDEIQQNLFDRAKAYREEHITKVDSWDEFMEVLENKGGFVYAHWDGTTETELEIKEKSKATIRCIPLGWEEEAGVCVLSGKASSKRVLFAKAY